MLRRIERVMREHGSLRRVLFRVWPPGKAAAALTADKAAIHEERGTEAVVERRFQQGLLGLLRRQARFLQRCPGFHEATHILCRDMLGQIEHEALRTGVETQRPPVRVAPAEAMAERNLHTRLSASARGPEIFAVEYAPFQLFLQTDEVDAADGVEIAVDDVGLAIAEAGIELSGGLIAGIRVDAEDGTAVRAGIVLIELYELRPEAVPLLRRFDDERVQHHHLLRRGVKRPVCSCVAVHLRLIDTRGGDDRAVLLHDEEVIPIERLACSFLGGIDAANPADGRLAALFEVVCMVIDGGNHGDVRRSCFSECRHRKDFLLRFLHATTRAASCQSLTGCTSSGIMFAKGR